MSELAQIDISAEDFPAYRPEEYTREFFGKIGQGMELEMAPQTPIHIRVSALVLGAGVVVGGGSINAMTTHRTSGMRSDGNSDILVCFPRQRMLVRERGGREELAQSGQAVLGALDRPVSFVSREHRNDFVALQVSRQALAPYTTHLDDHLVRVSDPGDPRFRVLRDYAASLQPDVLAAPRLRDLAVRHLLELTALAIAPSADGRAAAMCGGLRAARLVEAKRAVMEHLEEPGLCADLVAGLMGVSERYVRKLFEEEPETFAEFVTRRRLERAVSLLLDPARPRRAILDIALSVGFADVGTFNRNFRSRFGRTPSDIRASRDQA